MPTGKSNLPEVTKNNELGFERIVFFSDAVMAIAITLLAIDLKAPETVSVISGPLLTEYLSSTGPRIMSFVISFTVVGIYWISHHRNFNDIRRYDNRLLVLNLVFLLFIALMPDPQPKPGGVDHPDGVPDFHPLRADQPLFGSWYLVDFAFHCPGGSQAEWRSQSETGREARKTG